MKNQKLSAIVQTLMKKNKKRGTVRIAAGELHQEESILRDWAALTQATPLANAKLHIRIIPAEQQCMWCFLVYRPKQGETQCPQCGSVGAKIIHGEELQLDEG
ncbi:MAG: hydrogenase maturation nickel metallochaperone HypA [Anaerolineales bacterium]|jgi:Zn finger protein HypA/HybF involved in hydrogenase expression|nr:hydrogenase maturation nickel metallochaperone HypA [Chloroflexota bacterium]MBK6646503.1 hydrogenase maturation nickel metallochaperone HypA [Anaerolineales bacterium]MCC6984943.1 hydrogenase maturation nickel metallochaperone HypA [Anaerolineales bacterium]